MTLSDTIAIFAAVVAMAAVAYAIVGSLKSDSAKELNRRIDEIEFKQTKVFDLIKADSYITDIIAGALHSLNKRQTITYQLLCLTDDDEFYAREEMAELVEIHRRLTELGLFSEDSVRRISAQRSLAHSFGDFQSLKLMQRIEKGDVGYRDIEIKEQISVLEKRLKSMHAQQTSWGGRPGGGSF